MQMVFSNGLESPLFETAASADNQLKSLAIDTSRDIRLISMLVDSGRYYHGIRFADANNKIISEVTWYDQDWGVWTPLQEVPEGE